MYLDLEISLQGKWRFCISNRYAKTVEARNLIYQYYIVNPTQFLNLMIDAKGKAMSSGFLANMWIYRGVGLVHGVFVTKGSTQSLDYNLS